MSTVLDALRKAEEGRDRGGGGGFVDEPPPEPPRRGGRRWLWVLLGLVALVVAFAGGFELSGDEAPEPEVVAETDEVIETRVAAAPEPPTEVAPAPPREGALPPPPLRQKEREVEPVEVAPPTTNNAPAAVKMPKMSDRRRRVLERVKERRAERESRRESRWANRQQSQGLRDAIRAAATPEERERLLEEFREVRRIARAERKAAAAERRLDREEQKLADGAHDVTGLWDPKAEAPRRDVAPARVAAARPPASPPVAAPAAPRAEPPPVAAARPGAPVPAEAPPPEAAEPAPAEATTDGPATTVALGPPKKEGLRRPPSGAPQVRINILQWSSDPRRRFAYMSIDGNPAMTQVREGESYQGLTVKRIFPEQVEFAHQGSIFVLRAN